VFATFGTSVRQLFRTMRRDDSGIEQKLSWGVTKRILKFSGPYRRQLVAHLAVTVLSAVIAVATPLLAGEVVSVISRSGSASTVTSLALVIAGLALLDAAMSLMSSYLSFRIGEGLIYDLRTKMFEHLQRMGIASFVRTQTGALVSRINNDVVGAQQAFTSTLSGVVSNVIGLVVTAAVMFTLSWQVTVLALILLPVFLLPARAFVGRLRSMMRESYNLNASMSTITTERFNVSGALLVTLFGRPMDEKRSFAASASKVRDIGIRSAMYSGAFFAALTLVATLAQALTYGVGGALALRGSLDAGSVVALALLLTRLYGPLTELSHVRLDIMRAVVAFNRVFEIIDLPPLIAEKPDAEPLPAGALSIVFDDVHFAYPSADQVSLASLEQISIPDHGPRQPVLHGVSFRVEPGQLVALVGPSGAGKSTISQLVPRIYDVQSGAVLIGGVDVREARLQSVRDAIGVVSQDAHLFHETIRANLTYAKPGATEQQMIEALCAAQIWGMVTRLPEGLDTVVGDHGYRLSGGEKQRLAIARVLLKAPDIVILDEATAHLDSESESAVQQALGAALAGRTSLVIAHRLSTVVRADQILVLESGHIVQRGTHAQLIAAGGLYAKLCRTQFTTAD
jgi:ATP-binding cassette subfamily B protein